MICDHTRKLLRTCECDACVVAKGKREAWFAHVSDCGACAEAVLAYSFGDLCDTGFTLRRKAQERTRWRP